MEIQKIFKSKPIVINENEKILSNNESNIIKYNGIKRKITVLHPKTKKENIIYLENGIGFYAEIIEKVKDGYYLYVNYNTGKKKFYKLKE